MAFDQKASMAVIEEAPIHHGIEVPSSPPPPLNASDRPKSDDQDSPNQKNPLPHLHPHHQLSLDARQYTPILNPGQPDKNKGGFDSIGNRFGEVKELEEMFSKLNPLAEEFVPPSLTNPRHGSENGFSGNGLGLDPGLRFGDGGVNPSVGRQWKKGGFNQFRRRNNNGRTTMAQGKEATRRTVFVSDIDHQVTEEQLAALFINCGQVVDCRICGDPNSVLRFAFVEFTDEESALAALTLSGTMLGFYPVKVLPSKTQIVPVNPNLLPQNEDERDMCARTIYCTNIDSKVSHGDVKLFFESICGQVHRLRLLGDYNHPTRIAFVEFVMAESAIAALNCSGVVLGSLPIRVSPSKTPVRPRSPRVLMH